MTATGRNIAQMTWTEVRDLDKADAALVLPIGSLEQHGPHLSVDTDLFFAERLLDLALERLPDTIKIFRLPILPISKSNEHIGFPGSFWLSAETLSAVVHDIAGQRESFGVPTARLVELSWRQPGHTGGLGPRCASTHRTHGVQSLSARNCA